MLVRLLVRRLLRYRLAWLLFGLLSVYLACMCVVLISAQRQLTIRGPVSACVVSVDAASGQTMLAMTLRVASPSADTTQSFLAPTSDFMPQPTANICHAATAQMIYETGAFGSAPMIDSVTTQSADGHTIGLFRSISRGDTSADFLLRQRLQLALFGGGIGSIGLAMLLAGLCWGQLPPLRPSLAQRRARELATIPPAFLRQVAYDLRWLDGIPWGRDVVADASARNADFQRGIAFTRGWNADEQRLETGVGILARCAPAYAETGAAEAALAIGRYDLLTFAPAAVSFAIEHARRAVAYAPASPDTRITLTHALAAQCLPPALAEAEDILRALRNDAPGHPRLAGAIAAVYLARRQYPQAIIALRAALDIAPSVAEQHALLDQLAQALLRGGNVRQAVRLFAELSHMREVAHEPPAPHQRQRSLALLTTPQTRPDQPDQHLP